MGKRGVCDVHREANLEAINTIMLYLSCDFEALFGNYCFCFPNGLFVKSEPFVVVLSLSM